MVESTLSEGTKQSRIESMVWRASEIFEAVEPVSSQQAVFSMFKSRSVQNLPGIDRVVCLACDGGETLVLLCHLHSMPHLDHIPHVTLL